MKTFDTPGDAKFAIMSLAANSTSSLPDDIRLWLIKLCAEPSPVVAIVDAAELLYARAADLDDDARILAASLAMYAAGWGWHQMQVDDRGMRMAQAMQRDSGVEGVWPDVASDPTPQGRFASVTMPVLPPPEV